MAPIAVLTCKSLNINHQKLPLHKRMDVGVAGHFKKGIPQGESQGQAGAENRQKSLFGFIHAILEWPALE